MVMEMETVETQLVSFVVLVRFLFIVFFFLDGGTYDYVIVGAGPGASVLASELSKQNTVLILETGTFSLNLVDLRIFFRTFLKHYP